MWRALSFLTIEMCSRKLRWFYMLGVCVLYICTSCTVCPAVLCRCLTHSIDFVPLNPQTPFSCASCWEVRAGPSRPQEWIQFSLFALLLCEYAITWLVKCYLVHKIAVRTSAYVIWVIGQSEWGRKLPEQLINLIRIFWNVFLQFSWVCLVVMVLQRLSPQTLWGSG